MAIKKEDGYQPERVKIRKGHSPNAATPLNPANIVPPPGGTGIQRPQSQPAPAPYNFQSWHLLADDDLRRIFDLTQCAHRRQGVFCIKDGSWPDKPWYMGPGWYFSSRSGAYGPVADARTACDLKAFYDSALRYTTERK